MRSGSLRWWFENRETGDITIAQFPNPPLWIAATGWILGRLFDGTIGTAATVATFGALIWWAIDEIIRGVNPWRKALGAAVLVWQVGGLVT